MLGEKSGVYALLKHEIPHIIKAHCTAHRLELSFADTLSAVPILQEAKEMLQGLWKQYHYSPKAVRELKEIAESMEGSSLQGCESKWYKMGPTFTKGIKCSFVEKLPSNSYAFATSVSRKRYQSSNARQSSQLQQEAY